MAWWRFWERERPATAPAAEAAVPVRGAIGPPAWSLLPALAPTVGPIELTAPVQRIADGLAAAAPLDRALTPLAHGTGGPPGVLHGVLRPHAGGLRTRHRDVALDHARTVAGDDDAPAAPATLRWPTTRPTPAAPPAGPAPVLPPAPAPASLPASAAPVPPPAEPSASPVGTPTAPGPPLQIRRAPRALAAVPAPPASPAAAAALDPVATGPAAPTQAGSPSSGASPTAPLAVPARTVVEPVGTSVPSPSPVPPSPVPADAPESLSPGRAVVPVATPIAAPTRPGSAASPPIAPPVPDPITASVPPSPAPPSSTVAVPRRGTTRTHLGSPLTSRPPSMVRERPAPPPSPPVGALDAAAPRRDIAGDARATPGSDPVPVTPGTAAPMSVPVRAASPPVAAVRDLPSVPPALRLAGSPPRPASAPVRPLASARRLGASRHADGDADAPAAVDAPRGDLDGLAIVTDAAPVTPPLRRRAGITTMALPAPARPAVAMRWAEPAPVDMAPETARAPAPQRAPESVPADLRAELEPVLGVDVGRVPVHRGAESSDAARSLRAKAFTHQGEVHLPAHHGPTGAGEGRTILAHELTHAVQQRRLGAALPPEASLDGMRLEHEARTVAGQIGPRPRVTARAVPGTLPTTPPPLPAAAPAASTPQRIAADVQAAALDTGAATPTGTVPGTFGVRFTPPPPVDDGVGPVFTGARGAEAAPAGAAPSGPPPAAGRGEPGAPPMTELSGADLERLAGNLYPHWRRQYRDELLSDRERTGTLHDVH